jgi:GTP cyclohydrolase I
MTAQNGYKLNGNNGTNGHHDNGHHEDGQTPLQGKLNNLMYTDLIIPGQGKLEGMTFDTNEQIERSVHSILEAIGEDPEREGLQRTPHRVAKMYAELTAGYHVDPQALINDAIFTVDYDEMVLVKNIDYYSLCEHHMLPFLGRAHVAYIPNGKVVGLSKIPRIVEMFARRLQVQERMTVQIADFINEALQPHGVAVVLEGLHMCSVIRGVKKSNARMTTSALRGVFRTDPRTRAEFMGHIDRTTAPDQDW